jgi:hypothetical protein
MIGVSRTYALDRIFHSCHILIVKWTVFLHSDFIEDAKSLPAKVHQELMAKARFLQEVGPQLGRPLVDTLKGSKHANMKELRFTAMDGVWRAAFAFDIRRQAVVLVAGDKSGVSQDRFYKQFIEIADERFDKHLKALEEADNAKNTG